MGSFEICLEGNVLQIVKECITELPSMSGYEHLVEGKKSVTHIVDTIWTEEISLRIYDIVHRKLVPIS
jgi:hypothetical protein